MLRLSVLLLVSYAVGCAEPTSEQPPPPNIIFILADDLGLADINSFDPLGRTYYETPHIDRLGEEGMKFLQAYTNAANCTPTRAALISGQYFPNQPIYHVGDSGPGAMIPAENAHHLPLDKITDAEMLKQAGYTTALIGKWHLGNHLNMAPCSKDTTLILEALEVGTPVYGKAVTLSPTTTQSLTTPGQANT